MLPAGIIFGQSLSSCQVLEFVPTSCGTAVVSWAMGAHESSWLGFSSNGFDVPEATCWFEEFGRVCAAVVSSGQHTIGGSSCSGFGGLVGITSSPRTYSIGVSDAGVRAANVSEPISYGGPGSCPCW